MQNQSQNFGVSVCILTETKYPTSSLTISDAGYMTKAMQFDYLSPSMG